MKKTRLFSAFMAMALMLGSAAGIPEKITGTQDSSVMTVDAAVVNYSVYTVTGHNVYLRKTSGGAKTNVKLPNLAYVSVTNGTIDGKWFKVKYKDSTGWVSSSEIKYKPTVTYIVNTKNDPLALRTGPFANATVMKYISKGDTVHYIETSGDWYKVVWNGFTGYCNKKYLKRK